MSTTCTRTSILPDRLPRRRGSLAGLVCAALLAACGTSPTSPSPMDPVQPRGPVSGRLLVGLITKTESNPFFVRMREGALRRAGELGVELRTFAGRYDGDTAAQISSHRDPARRWRQRHSDYAVGSGGPSWPRGAGARDRRGGHRARHALRSAARRGRNVRHRQLPRRRTDRQVGARADGRRRGAGADRDAGRVGGAGHGRCAAQPGLPRGLRHRHPERAADVRRGRSAPRRQRLHDGHGSRRPARDGAS